MKLISVESAWDSYSKLVIPDGACDAQIKETRLSFYAGATAMFMAMSTLEIVEDESVKKTMLGFLGQELEDFRNSL